MDVALDLFTEHGYDKTSLREIAEALGVTKAALYYHFERKEDILLALHLRLHALGHGALEQLAGIEINEATIEAWARLLDEFIDQVLANRKLFLFHVRNQNALQLIENSEHNESDHEDFEQRLRRVIASPGIPAPLRVRIACSIGAVMGGLMGAGEALEDVPTSELASFVREAVRDLLGLGAPRSATRDDWRAKRRERR